MDFRKINSYAILLAIVVVVGLLVSMIARFVILEKGADTGTANLVFIIVMGVCAIFYLTVMRHFPAWRISLLTRFSRKLPERMPLPSKQKLQNLPIMFRIWTLSKSSRR